MRRPGPRHCRSRHGRRTHTRRSTSSSRLRSPRLLGFLLLGDLLPRLLRHPAGLDRSVPDLLPMMLLLVFDVAKVRAGMLNIEVVGHGFSPDKQQFPLAGWRRGYRWQQVLVGKVLPV